MLINLSIQDYAVVERLEVDLDGGFGEATLHMRYENTPTASEADHHSGAPGAGDKIGFNNPTPGKWQILLDSESVFSGVSITASFEDLYIWPIAAALLCLCLEFILARTRYLRIP